MVNDTNGSHETSDESSCANENGQSEEKHVCTESNGLHDNNKRPKEQKDNCKCGNDKAKDKSHRKNGFINEAEERPPKGLQETPKKPRGLQVNGCITPPACVSCGQTLSPRDKFERGYSDRGREYPEKCAKCSSLKADVANKRNRKKYGRQKEVTITIPNSDFSCFGEKD